MDEQMEEVCEKECVFEETLQIDFDYEFDVAKFFDFTRPETDEEVRDSECWFHLAQGHPPSPLLIKLGLMDELGSNPSSPTSSPKSGHQYEYSTSNFGGISEDSGFELLKSKSKPATRSCLSKSSRLLQPTASHLAKQNQERGTRGTRVPGRVQKPGSLLKSPADIDATKRQKLDVGYLRKAAHLKHQTSFSHKLPKKVASPKPKVTISKEPHLETANRAQRRRSKTSAELARDSSFKTRPLSRKILDSKSKTAQPLGTELQRSKSSVCGGKAATKTALVDLRRTNSLKVSKENSDQMYKLQACRSNKKIYPLKDITDIKESLPSDSKKLLQNPPVELFAKLSLTAENQSSLLPEEGKCLGTKVSKKNAIPRSMKENKNANTMTGKPTRCCLKPSQFTRGRMTTVTAVI